MENIKEPILFSGGGWNIFSNFSSYAIEYEGTLWPTSEHLYQAAKFTDKKIIEKIKNAKSAYDAKMIALDNEDKVKENWHNLSLSIMEEIIKAKIAQHPHVKKKLLETDDREIIEATDNDFWGWGKDQKGQNYLGKIWMKLRDEIKNKLWNQS